jgi:hypothetical protein
LSLLLLSVLWMKGTLLVSPMLKLLPGRICSALNRSGDLSSAEQREGIQQEPALHGSIPRQRGGKCGPGDTLAAKIHPGEGMSIARIPIGQVTLVKRTGQQQIAQEHGLLPQLPRDAQRESANAW